MLEYCSVNLLEQNDVYKNKYFQYKREGKDIILHHGDYGLEYFVYWIKQLNPKWYILPSISGDKDKSIKIFKEFSEKYDYLPKNLWVTPQGKNINELYQSFDYLHNQNLVKGISLPERLDFSYDMYDNKEKAVDYALNEFTDEIIAPFYNTGKYWKPVYKINIKILG